MYVKSMVIDGFKSYGQRTEITGFDRFFNAITGLNGSGKSNILDAICFLLGITNLSQVRATGFQELIYKNGQAGITKATVSITFDNSDKDQSPVGYESYETITVTRQTVLGGKNKYLINGSNAANNRVTDLFGSVQLNVNNPHFLIMQGRVTKVLNMKPPEILMMIEEAAGTRMYESKKQAAEKTIAKKDMKLKEIETILDEEIGPSLNRLRIERQSYLDYSKTVREFDQLKKILTAWHYWEATKDCDVTGHRVEEFKTAIIEHKRMIEHLETEKQGLADRIRELEKQKDEQAGGELQDLERSHKDQQLQETRASAHINNLKETFKVENKKKKGLEKHIAEDEAAIAKKEKDLEKLLEAYQGKITKGQQDSEAYLAAQKHFQAVSTGLSSKEGGEAGTLAEQLMNAKSGIADLTTESKQAEMKLARDQAEMGKKRKQCQETADAYKKDENLHKSLVSEIAALKRTLEKVGFTENQYEDLITRRQQVQRQLTTHRDELDLAEARAQQLSFHYKDPQPGFQRKKVNGLVARNLKLKSPEYATALEKVAGGRLYNVIVDNEVTGKQLIQKGHLRQRYTMIPLNKIQTYNIAPAKVAKAKELVGHDNVWEAVSLVDYSAVVDPAMRYVFGGTLVCRTMDQAKKLAFHPQVETRTVTLDGEVFDPSGTLSGGFVRKEASNLLKIAELERLEAILQAQTSELKKIEEALASLNAKKDAFAETKTKLDSKESKLETIKVRLESSSHHQLLEQIRELEISILDLQQTIERNAEATARLKEKVKDIELKLKDSKGHQERELKAAQAELDRCKQATESSSKETETGQAKVDSIKLEIQELKKSLDAQAAQIAEIERAVEVLEADISKADDELKGMKAKSADALEHIKSKRTEIEHQSKEITKLRKEKTVREENQSQRSLQIKQLEADIQKTQDDAKLSARKVKSLETDNEWIKESKQFFGVPGTEFDFQSMNLKETTHRIKKLEETKEKLSKNVNMRAQNLMTKTETDYNNLVSKRQVVLADKATIYSTIKELDEKKEQVLKEAYEKVNKDFGSIFSLLLLGAQAKLTPVEGKSFLEGLEVKVAFNNVWKESLNELSGGQRSLVALSLILAMLRFKPAPIYILDEVDAALDISHTQNIGQMLRTHFQSSQFIIVSLKDGMFNNANVLFRTKFIDGNSTVSKSVQAK